MKKITLLGVLLQFVLHSCSNIKPPQNIVDAFAINYPSVTSVVWEQEEINLWEAKFKQDAIIYSAVFNLKGDLVEKEHTIKFKELPEVIKQAINIKYLNFDIDEVEFIENESGSFYEIEIEKGNNELEIVYTTNGEFVSEQVEDKLDEDN